MKNEITETGTQKLLSFIDAHPEQKNLIKEVIVLWDDIRHMFAENYCQVCDKELSITEYKTISEQSFLRTCDTHRKESMFFQVSIVRERLGIPPRKDFIKEMIMAL